MRIFTGGYQSFRPDYEAPNYGTDENFSRGPSYGYQNGHQVNGSAPRNTYQDVRGAKVPRPSSSRAVKNSYQKEQPQPRTQTHEEEKNLYCEHCFSNTNVKYASYAFFAHCILNIVFFSDGKAEVCETASDDVDPKQRSDPLSFKAPNRGQMEGAKHSIAAVKTRGRR